MCTVGTVYAASPAMQAGLCQGDSIIAFGPVQADGYKGVSESIVPVVKASVGKPIDVIVVRMSDKDQQVKQLQLTLTPQKWSGAGLLGCILK
jgi:predicted metalloprotease with PDZ domain